MIKYTFPRKLRLLSSDNFIYVFQKPKKASTSHAIVLGRLNKLNHPRIGFTVSKKHVKLAYERNRIKRLVRESFRLYQHELPAMDFVFIAKKNLTNLDNHAVRKSLKQLWNFYCR